MDSLCLHYKNVRLVVLVCTAQRELRNPFEGLDLLLLGVLFNLIPFFFEKKV